MLWDTKIALTVNNLHDLSVDDQSYRAPEKFPPSLCGDVRTWSIPCCMKPTTPILPFLLKFFRNINWKNSLWYHGARLTQTNLIPFRQRLHQKCDSVTRQRTKFADLGPLSRAHDRCPFPTFFQKIKLSAMDVEYNQ